MNLTLKRLQDTDVPKNDCRGRSRLPWVVVSHDKEAPKTNLVCRQEVFLSKKVQTKFEIILVLKIKEHISHLVLVFLLLTL